jgi:hypothetical protein
LNRQNAKAAKESKKHLDAKPQSRKGAKKSVNDS